MSVLRLVGWSCIAYAFMVLARTGVAFAAHLPTPTPTRSARRPGDEHRKPTPGGKRIAA